MIIDHISHIQSYAGLGKHFRTACEWLAGQDLSALMPGDYPIDGRNVFASVADNELSRETPAYEAHRLYADIQLIISGRELFRFGTKGTVPERKPDTDFYPCEVEADLPFTLEDGWFVIFLPKEIHAPGNPAGAPSVCRKMVVKVLCPEAEGPTDPVL